MAHTLTTEQVTARLTTLIQRWESLSDQAFNDMSPASGAAYADCVKQLGSYAAELTGTVFAQVESTIGAAA